LQAVTGGVVGGSPDAIQIEGSPVLESDLLVEIRDAAMLPDPGIASLREGVVPEVVHLGQDVVEK